MADPAYNWQSCVLSHVGKVRKLNEDSCLDRGEIGLWVVADGMGGHSAGDLASQLIVNTLGKVSPPADLATFVDQLEDALLAVNQRLFKMSAEHQQTVGSTVAALVAHGRHVVYLWAGDSRVYRLRNGRFSQLTTDHSQVERLIEQGLLSREQAAHHPQGNMVTRAVGAAETLFVDMDMDEMAPGDRYLLCSDGLDKHLNDEEIGRILAEGTPEQACRRLIEETLARGAMDNVTAGVVEILVGGPGAASRADADATAVDPDATQPAGQVT